MLRRLLIPVFLIGLVVPGAMAQEETPTTQIYIATYKISFGDIPGWTEDYNTDGVPILEALVEEGVIRGFNMRMHNTGGEYNIRQGIIGDDGTDFDSFWEQYLDRLRAANPQSFARTNRMIQAHQDEVWTIDVLNIGDGDGPGAYFYEAKFQVNFQDLESFAGMWEQDVFPALDQAMADGLLRGYVTQGHHTGGPFNWKIGFLFDEWDDIDDVEAVVFGAMPLDHPMWDLFSAHVDELWQAMPSPN